MSLWLRLQTWYVSVEIDYVAARIQDLQDDLAGLRERRHALQITQMQFHHNNQLEKIL